MARAAVATNCGRGSCRGSWNVILLLEGRLVILIRLIDVGVA